MPRRIDFHSCSRVLAWISHPATCPRVGSTDLRQLRSHGSVIRSEPLDDSAAFRAVGSRANTSRNPDAGMRLNANALSTPEAGWPEAGMCGSSRESSPSRARAGDRTTWKSALPQSCGVCAARPAVRGAETRFSGSHGCGDAEGPSRRYRRSPGQGKPRRPHFVARNVRIGWRQCPDNRESVSQRGRNCL